MGGYVKLMLEVGEVSKLKEVFEDGQGITGPKYAGFKTGCWIEIKSNNVELGYPVHWLHGEWANAVGLQICKLFKIKNARWDGGDWCKEEFLKSRPFDVRIEMTEAVIKKGDKGRGFLSGISWQEDLKMMNAMRLLYEKKAKELFEVFDKS